MIIKKTKLFLLIIMITSCMFLLTGCTDKKVEDNKVENAIENVVADATEDNNVNKKYGFISKTTDEEITVNLEEDPRPESFKIGQAIEKSLLDAGYEIDLIEIDGYGSALGIDFTLKDGSTVALTFGAKDKISSVISTSDTDETLTPLARTVIETKELNISEEERNTMLSSTEYIKMENWQGYIGDTYKGDKRMFNFSRYLFSD